MRLTVSLFSGRLTAGTLIEVAGEEGFEPSHAGIKTQCLNQLGDSPADLLNPGQAGCSVNHFPPDAFLISHQADESVILSLSSLSIPQVFY